MNRDNRMEQDLVTITMLRMEGLKDLQLKRLTNSDLLNLVFVSSLNTVLSLKFHSFLFRTAIAFLFLLCIH